MTATTDSTTAASATAASQPADSNALVQIRRVRKSFGNHEVLRDISLAVPAGTVTVLLGPSGSGKSTLLRCVNHLETIDGGRIIVDGDLIGYRQHGNKTYEMTPRQIAKQRANIGMVFQKFNLFPHLTAVENIMEAPVGVAGRGRGAAKARALDLLDRVGLTAFANHYPAQLSGGQQQRVAIARALAMDPKLMLFDEPTSALDPELVGDVLDVMRELANDGMTMIVVTHEIGFARGVADQVAFMDGGVVVEVGPPSEVLDNPQRQRTRNFLESVK
ncbi:amino acid ABC transporter ATP-binding protein [Leucobacter aridicollis]|uniref:amino acid ABC transporter ATP-binding protein n=1 Tax=Leucobacter aridicollis TaxID=283878 RepID=UPI002166D0BE|nr:amino acid ABC transporter ATP-binding protein [Leucobacter aridicollis]MCS3428822.1 polar amino acid transport system ATP-binding protein [Leucobacter aridicollis]